MDTKTLLQLLQILTDFAVAHGKRPSEEASIVLLNNAKAEMTELAGAGAIVDACYDLMCKVRTTGKNHAAELEGKDAEKEAAVAAEKSTAAITISAGLADYARDERKIRDLETQNAEFRQILALVKHNIATSGEISEAVAKV